MPDPLTESILAALEYVRNEYYRLVFVGRSAIPVLPDVASATGFPLINFSLEISRSLREVPLAQRARRLRGIAQSIVNEKADDGVILTRIELLFLPSLLHDPVRTLLELSRRQPILAVWPGEGEDGRLRYAEPSHPEYHDSERGDIIMVPPFAGAPAVFA
ncbi:MAG TPA: BREX-3 system P-loop-containing protein BrxF [Gammaproteobacteria bacterium]|nr:BREX-3 system P-loop-containing protein BrxF [Longimicrobiaceae bacterium]HET7369783.1 BREX-3 system P-loop-containing protein BrxF [Gammaproteobacteria bacterium]